MATKATAKKTSAAKRPAKKATPKRAQPERAAPVTQTVQFYRDGKPVYHDFRLSHIAFHYTAGIDGKDSKRVSTARLREILAQHKVTDPQRTEWSVKLPNGVTISTKFDKARQKVAEERAAKKTMTATRNAARASGETTAAGSTLPVKKAAGEKLKAAGRYHRGPHQITITEENAQALADMTVAQIKALPDEAVEVTPLPKPTKATAKKAS